MAKAIKWDALLLLAVLIGLALETDRLLRLLREIQQVRARLAAPAPAARSAKPATAAAGPAHGAASAVSVPPVADANSRAARLRAAMVNPAFLRQLAILQRQMIAGHYGALFDALKLDPAARERFSALLAKKQLAKSDAEDAAYENGLFGTGAVIPAIEAAQQPVNDEIAQLLGPDSYAEYHNFEMTDGLRTTLQRLQSALQDTTEPLSDSAVDSMVAALNGAIPADQRGGIGQFTGASAEIATGLGAPLFSAVLPANAPELLGSQLSAAQARRLRALMEQQQNEMALRSMLLTSASHPSAPAP
jgi:hypothetical protein